MGRERDATVERWQRRESAENEREREFVFRGRFFGELDRTENDSVVLPVTQFKNLNSKLDSRLCSTFITYFVRRKGKECVWRPRIKDENLISLYLFCSTFFLSCISLPTLEIFRWLTLGLVLY